MTNLTTEEIIKKTKEISDQVCIQVASDIETWTQPVSWSNEILQKWIKDNLTRLIGYNYAESCKNLFYIRHSCYVIAQEILWQKTNHKYNRHYIHSVFLPSDEESEYWKAISILSHLQKRKNQ